MKRPNVLILMSDEHRYDVTGYAGNQIVKTPHLDRLASEGVVFTNAYAPSPICAPSRQCLAAGQLTKTCHVEGSWMDLKPEYPTFAKRFSQYAYRTVCSGKLHHMGVDQMQGWSRRLAPDAEVYDKYAKGLIKEEFLSYQGGKSKNKMMDEMIVKKAHAGDGGYQKFDWNAYQAMSDYVSKECHTEGRPHLLKLSLLEPHFPYVIDQKRFDYYYDKVPVFLDEPSDHPVLRLSQDNTSFRISEGEVRRATATYYGMTEAVDEYFGKIMKDIENKGHSLDDWIIVYISDHGEMLGQHGIWEKSRFYEASVRVPMIIRYPKMFKGGQKVEQNVSLCDLYATLCDLAQITVPPNLDSRSLVPLMSDSSAPWQNEVVSQIKRNKVDHVMIKQDALKYQYYGEEISEVLFDLAKDPQENINFINDPQYAEKIACFRKRLSALGYGKNPCKNYHTAGYEVGVEEMIIEDNTLWPEDSNPWQDQLS